MATESALAPATLPGALMRLACTAPGGSVSELVARPGRHLVWTTRGEGRRLFPSLAPLAVVPWPDGRPNYALYAVEGPAARAQERHGSVPADAPKP